MKNILIKKKSFKELDFEIVERKGMGHPDTLADALAERLSANYSNYTLDKFGAILHHNFDKIGLLGGYSYVAFGKGYMIKPIRVLLNGRVSTNFGAEKIPCRRLLVNWTKDFFREKLPLIDVDEDLDFHINLSNQSSPGKTYEEESKKGARRRWFEPRDFRDLPELRKLVSNDTSLGVGFSPPSTLEVLVLDIEKTLTSKNYRTKNRWIGTDIKVMGARNGNLYSLTICIPQIANFVNTLEEYKNNLKKARNDIVEIFQKHKISNFELNMNTRDDYALRELYLTATGSSIENGDEGLVGRGNRVNGLITPTRPMSIEGVCGKNPVYHIGKLYYIAASRLADKIYKKWSIPNEVYLANQTGRDLVDPWIVTVVVPEEFANEKELKELINEGVKNIPKLTEEILKGNIRLY